MLFRSWLQQAAGRSARLPRLGVNALRSGMVLARDLTAGNVLLIPQGRAIDDTLIAALRQFEQRQGIKLELEIDHHDETL